jgi:hypothetical protein
MTTKTSAELFAQAEDPELAKGVTREQMITAIRKATNKKPRGTRPDYPRWPGLPIGQVAPWERPMIRALLAEGVIEMVSRPRYTDPSALASFYRIVKN